MKLHLKLCWIVAFVLPATLSSVCLADDCSDGISCYTQALVKLQAARDEFSNATKGIDALKKDVAELHNGIEGLKNENVALKAALAAAVDRIDSIRVSVSTKTFPVAPSSPSGGVIDCPDPGPGLHTVAVASGLYLNEADERNASFARWYTWPKSSTEFGYYMINGAGTGMGHPPGNFAAYIGCLVLK